MTEKWMPALSEEVRISKTFELGGRTIQKGTVGQISYEYGSTGQVFRVVDELGEFLVWGPGHPCCEIEPLEEPLNEWEGELELL